MTVRRLESHMIPKPWGRRTLGAGFAAPGASDDPIGEIHFGGDDGTDRELLVKYLFTGEKLSVQVHPDAEMARSMGLRRGKDEAWVILEAASDAMIGLGLREAMSAERLEALARDGVIEAWLDWRAVSAGDVFYSPAGTIHAIGAGIAMVEIQQNCDTTYRLHDWDRDRPLHIAEAVAAARPVPYVAAHIPCELSPGRRLLADGPAFVLERWSGAHEVRFGETPGPVWIVPLAGEGTVGGEVFARSEVWLAEGAEVMTVGESGDLLVAYPGDVVMPAETRG